jgi:hypothetical protein
VVISHPETVQVQPTQEIEQYTKPAQNQPDPRKRIPKEFPTIPNAAQNQPIPDAQKDVPMLQMPEVEKEGDVGRKRKNEDSGIYGDISVRQIVLYRHIRGHHFPGLSADMKAWYQHFYFKAPAVGEKPYRGRDYEQHKRAYERGREWVKEHEASHASAAAVGNSGATVIPFQRRANS